MVQLRALEPEDIDFLYNLENDRTLWEVSETQAPFSRQLLLSYIATKISIRPSNNALLLPTKKRLLAVLTYTTINQRTNVLL